MAKFNATQLSTIMQAGYTNQRKGALQSVLSNAALTLVKGGRLSPAEIKENLTGTKGITKDALKKAVTRHGNTSQLVADAIPYLDDAVSAPLIKLYDCTTEATFNKEVEKLIAKWAVLGQGYIKSLSDVELLFTNALEHGFDKDGFNAKGYNAEGYNAEGYNADGFNAEGYNADGKTADEIAQALQEQERQEQGIKEQQAKQLEQARAFAERAIAAMIKDIPALETAFEQAQSADTVESAVYTLALGFESEIKRLQAENLALQNKLGAKRPRAKAA